MSKNNPFDLLVSEYKETYLSKKKVYDISLEGEITHIRDALLDEKFKPSVQLKQILNKQIKRAVYPMEVAIVGQFSSGKSTFLNALLSKDVLPTGITPVTSKVIYINYGEEHRLKVTYTSGVHEYFPIEEIARFSDQRLKSMDDIKYLSIYLPSEILKELSFVDTPGLNSQSQSDTQSTKKVFQDVGGIIWLSMMDNAGKRSEQEILERTMSTFKTKSLCLLNQKDKFTEAQIAKSTAYIEKQFVDYFSKVIPLSAKQALDARCLEPTTQIDMAMNHLIKDFRKGLDTHPNCDSLQFFSDDFANFKTEVERIKTLDLSSLETQIEDSNIHLVIQYIEEVMRPNATEMKAFRIKNDLQNICDILINSYQTMLAVYDALAIILEKSVEMSEKKFDEIDLYYSAELKEIHTRIERIFKRVAQEIYGHTSTKTLSRYKETTSAFLKQEKIEKQSYESFRVDKNAVLDTLFYSDQQVEKSIASVMDYLETFEGKINTDFKGIYFALKADVTSWQHKYLLLSKNREISSDLEFSKVKRFASKVYENILNTFSTAMLEEIESFNKKSAYLNGALSYNFLQTVQVSMMQIEEKILESEAVHLKDPVKYSIHKPSEADMLERLKMNFDFEKLDEMFLSQNAYLHAVVKGMKKHYVEIVEEKKDFIASEKAPFLKKIEDLQQIKEMI